MDYTTEREKGGQKQVWYTPEGFLGINGTPFFVGVLVGANTLMYRPPVGKSPGVYIDYTRLKDKAGEWISGVKTPEDLDFLIGLIPTSPASADRPGLGESLIPFWGSARNMEYAASRGDLGGVAWNSGMFVADVFLVRAIIGGLATKTAGKALAEGGSRSLTHLTTTGAEVSIDLSGKIGARGGIFALQSSRVPGNAMLRKAVTFFAGRGRLTEPLLIPMRAGKHFMQPRVAGPFTAAFRALGWAKTPLGAVSPHTGRFVPGLVMRGGAFHAATTGDILWEAGHTLILFYGLDMGANAIGHGTPWALETLNEGQSGELLLPGGRE